MLLKKSVILLYNHSPHRRILSLCRKTGRQAASKPFGGMFMIYFHTVQFNYSFWRFCCCFAFLFKVNSIQFPNFRL